MELYKNTERNEYVPAVKSSVSEESGFNMLFGSINRGKSVTAHHESDDAFESLEQLMEQREDESAVKDSNEASGVLPCAERHTQPWETRPDDKSPLKKKKTDFKQWTPVCSSVKVSESAKLVFLVQGTLRERFGELAGQPFHAPAIAGFAGVLRLQEQEFEADPDCKTIVYTVTEKIVNDSVAMDLSGQQWLRESAEQEVCSANELKLGKLPFFRGASAEFLRAMAAGSRLRYYPKDHLLYQGSQKLADRIAAEFDSGFSFAERGTLAHDAQHRRSFFNTPMDEMKHIGATGEFDNSKSLVIVERGLVHIKIGRDPIGTSGPGAFFGAAALLSGSAEGRAEADRMGGTQSAAQVITAAKTRVIEVPEASWRRAFEKCPEDRWRLALEDPPPGAQGFFVFESAKDFRNREAERNSNSTVQVRTAEDREEYKQAGDGGRDFFKEN
jgi:CRP-like cAMP-binding protein